MKPTQHNGAAFILVMGYPGSGKTTYTQKLMESASEPLIRLNRDERGGTNKGLLGEFKKQLADGHARFVIDGAFATPESRAPFIKAATDLGIPTYCHWLQTSIEEAQVNVSHRILNLADSLLGPGLFEDQKHPGIYGPVSLFAYRKNFQPPTELEGFAEIIHVPFTRDLGEPAGRKALLLDYDGTLRECVGGNGKYPVEHDQVQVLERRTEILGYYRDAGYLLLGASNQSGIAKGLLTDDKARELFSHTNQLLEIDIEIGFCPHRSAPISCYCRKPMPGMAVAYMKKYDLHPHNVTMVGDFKSDETFAKRAGIHYVDADVFFSEDRLMALREGASL